MKQRIIYSILTLCLCSNMIKAQETFNEVLRVIAINNTTLKAYRGTANAEKIGNKTGLNPDNPEFEFGYLWGSPTDVGNETDISLKQSFDFPTAYKIKSQLSQEKNRQVDLVYEQQVRTILQQARILCVELTYQTKVNKQLVDRLQQAKKLTDAYQKLFDLGDIDILELNKTKVNFLITEKKLQINEVDIKTLVAELQRLNGGEHITSSILDYPIYSLPINYDIWFESIKEINPSIIKAQQDIVMSKKQEQLTRAMNMPKLSASYSRQDILGTTQQGVLVGISIPLWEGRNTVKHQKAQTIALQIQEEDVKLQFYNSLKNQFDKAYNLSIMLQQFAKLDISKDQELLNKALDLGQLPIVNYLLELSAYYDIADNYLETERDYQLAVAELQQWN